MPPRANSTARIGFRMTTALVEQFLAVRRTTEELCAGVSAEDAMLQSMADTSPVKWHLAHTTWFFETFLLEPHKAGYKSPNPAFRDLFNSYYNAVGAPPRRDRRGLFSLPSYEEVQSYREHVDRESSSATAVTPIRRSGSPTAGRRCKKTDGARLPTEFEWEIASIRLASEIGGESFLEAGNLHPRASAGDQFFGDAWQWTASAYLSYPGYKPLAGALGEYNGKFMCNQMVLRGASCATPRSHARTTYRNFFPPATRWQFSGIRLAR